jgi:N-methylhydantoinase B
VLEDVLDGFVSPESALKDYGVVLDPQTLEGDEVETARLRKDLRRETAMFHRGRYLHAAEA